MLVLARQCTQTILFPDQHIRVEVLAAKAGVVRLGIEAPPEVRVLRGELPDRVAEWGPEPDAAPRPHQLDQVTRQGLSMASVGLGLARLQADVGLVEDLRQTLAQLHDQLQWLSDQWEPAAGKRFKPAAGGECSEAEALAVV